MQEKRCYVFVIWVLICRFPWVLLEPTLFFLSCPSHVSRPVECKCIKTYKIHIIQFLVLHSNWCSLHVKLKYGLPNCILYIINKPTTISIIVDVLSSVKLHGSSTSLPKRTKHQAQQPMMSHIKAPCLLTMLATSLCLQMFPILFSTVMHSKQFRQR